MKRGEMLSKNAERIASVWTFPVEQTASLLYRRLPVGSPSETPRGLGWFLALAFHVSRFTFALALALAPALLAGCTASRPSPTTADSTKSLVWPKPPDPARIAFVQSVYRPADLGARASAFTRFGHWITGSDKGNEPLIKPFGIALDDRDNLCLTDTGANVVCYYDRAKKKWHRWNKVGPVRFACPVAVAKLRTQIFVADSTLGCVVAFDETGKLLFEITNHLARPAGLAISREELYVADSLRHCVVAFDLKGNFRREIGRRGTGPGEFNFPTHLAADSQGNLYVTDSMNGRIQIFDPQGRFKGSTGSLGDSPGHFSRPKGVAIDPEAHLYVVDAMFDNVQLFDQTGRLLLHVGESGSAPGEFWLPNGIAISRSNVVYVADSYNRRLQVFKYIGPS